MTTEVRQQQRVEEPVAVNIKSGSRMDLLKNILVSGIFKSRWFPGILQWPTAFVFILIVYALLFGAPGSHSNFGIALTWVLWWPIIPIIFVLVGRFWCAICPFGSLSDVVKKFVGHERPVPVFLKKYGIWIIDAMFILITWADHVFGIVASPWGSGVLLLMIVTGVTASAVLWERRTWCRHLCFLGGLSANYSQAGILSLKGTPEKCSKCTVSACFKGNEKIPGCPMFEYPRSMTTMAECNLCSYCVKSCPNDSVTLTVRKPTEELWSIKKPHFATAFLAAVIMGIVFVQNVTMLSIWNPIMKAVEGVTGTTNFTVNFTIVFVIFMLIPILLLGIASYFARAANRASIVQNFARFGYSIIALDVAAHIGHNLFHLFAEGGNIYITGAAFFGKPVQNVSPAILSTPTIQVMQFALIALGMIGSLYTAYRVSRSNFPEHKWASAIPFCVLVVLLSVANFIFFSMPMAHRM